MSATKRALDEPRTIARVEHISAAIEAALVEGDLSRLSVPERNQYYAAVCGSLGLNPLTKPFQYLRLNGKLVLYATKDCTDQLRGLRGLSVEIIRRETIAGVCEVTAQASTPDGRKDTDIGAVFVDGLKGESLANAVMKAHTKAKRRVTLSICGLGMVDESELETIPGANVVDVTDQGEPRKPHHSDAVADKLSAFRGLIADAATRDELIALTKQARTQGLAKALQEQIKERMREIEANVASVEDEERAAIESDGQS